MNIHWTNDAEKSDAPAGGGNLWFGISMGLIGLIAGYIVAGLV